MRSLFKTFMAAALLLGGAAAIEPSPASAQVGPERYSPSPRARPAPAIRRDFQRPRYDAPRSYRRAYYGRPYRSAYYGRRAYRPAYYGRRYYGGYPYGYYRRGYGGGAVVAGLIGGLTLGALASPYYAAPYYGPGYYRPAYYAPRCVLERRRVINRYGRPIWRRVQVCY
ncbi:hypothetical protein [Microvirga guangxiensis]|uniref:Lectin-like protein BA14k n=1 Tax=Microvirga guangxiensis TaxID=549386 RepID=A0A1G5GA02_9HYPH|nr:hypothetical protein [Microvirga guangxiensis]SCY48080.1 hypothetical protein SAMN02927923_01428 [Microvirga guangxiensis]